MSKDLDGSMNKFPLRMPLHLHLEAGSFISLTLNQKMILGGTVPPITGADVEHALLYILSFAVSEKSEYCHVEFRINNRVVFG